MEDMLRVGVITSPHGVHGEVKVFPTTDEPSRFRELKNIYIDKGNEKEPHTIEGVKFFKNLVILKLSGIDDMDTAGLLRKKDILIDRADALPLAEGEHYICDLIGLEVVSDEDIRLGVLKDVLQTGANDVYVVESPAGKELLIPVIKDCILDIDMESRIIKVHVLRGLFD